MTPCEKLGYKVGDKFITKGSHAFGDYSVIELQDDSGSQSSLFKLISGSCKYNNAKSNKAGAYCDLNFVKKIEEKEMTRQKKLHVHAEMMKAYADDVGLCVFVKFKSSDGWCETSNPVFDDSYKYFPCLPKHKDAVLNMLNGGQSQVKPAIGWIDAIKDDVKEWNPNYWYMLDDYESRIKPKKEKRWISYNPKTLRVYDCGKLHVPDEGFQVIEIEAEI